MNNEWKKQDKRDRRENIRRVKGRERERNLTKTKLRNGREKGERKSVDEKDE